MRVHWTENAVNHLAHIYEYIAFNSPTYARRMIDRITQRSEQIAEHAYSGRKVPEYDTDDIREVFEKPYRIIYGSSRIRLICCRYTRCTAYAGWTLTRCQWHVSVTSVLIFKPGEPTPWCLLIPKCFYFFNLIKKHHRRV
ncbi:MAG: type II toxin-antitoxin system RelE/ParE family toxin [Desulfobacterales bacterium]|nr:type II toxin-antitoxin system RelE/ParE family toxin [Desulfobacterales bacterium]